MRLLQERWDTAAPAAVAEQLHRAGAELRGRNLRRASWLEIAEGIRQQRVALLVLPRLRAATTRADALRILRLVRKLAARALRDSGKARGGRRSGSVPPRAVLSVKKDPREATEDHLIGVEEWEEWAEPVYPFDYRVWQAWDLLAHGATQNTLRDRVPAALWHALELLTRGAPAATGASSSVDATATPVAEDAVFAVFREIYDGEPSRFPLAGQDAFPRLTPADLETLSVLKVVTRNLDSGAEEIRLDRQERFLSVVMLAPLWIRPPAAWKPSPDTNLVRSLIDHLFVRFPVPPVLYEAWNDIPRVWEDLQNHKFLAWFILLGQGHNIRRVGRRFGWDVPKRFIDWLWRAPAHLGVYDAFIWAKVMCLGASPVEYSRLPHRGPLRFDPTGNPVLFSRHRWQRTEEYTEKLRFFEGWVRWLARYRDDLTDWACTELSPWAQHEYLMSRAGDRPPFNWSRRTPRSVSAAVRLYNAHPQRPLFQSLDWQSHGWNWSSGEWEIRELSSTEELAAEGGALRHCVASHDWDCLQGDSAIFSLRIGGVRALTIEMSVATSQIVQVKGLGNRAPSSDERAILQRWLDHIQHQDPPRA